MCVCVCVHVQFYAKFCHKLGMFFKQHAFDATDACYLDFEVSRCPGNIGLALGHHPRKVPHDCPWMQCPPPPPPFVICVREREIGGGVTAMEAVQDVRESPSEKHPKQGFNGRPKDTLNS